MMNDMSQPADLPDTTSDAIEAAPPDRKSTRLNSSHLVISYAVFCLKKKKKRFSSLEIVPTSASADPALPGPLPARQTLLTPPLRDSPPVRRPPVANADCARAAPPPR